jgi:hypothetical protein
MLNKSSKLNAINWSMRPFELAFFFVLSFVKVMQHSFSRGLIIKNDQESDISCV